MLAASLSDFLWTLLVLFFMVVYFVILFQVVVDLTRRHDISGWKKAAWVLFLIFLPFLGLFVYLIVNSAVLLYLSPLDQVTIRMCSGTSPLAPPATRRVALPYLVAG